MTTTAYHRPSLRAHLYQQDLPKVVTLHDHRFVAPGLAEALAGRAEVVGDTTYGAAALQLADILTPSVVLAGELLGDGAIDHFLPDLVRAGIRVLLLVDELRTDRVLDLVDHGLSGVCSTDRSLTEVADAVLEVAAGGAVLPPEIVASLVTQWRSGRRLGGTGPDERLTLRELEVLNAMTDGLSTKAIGRLLGVTTKTVENHKTRVFAKLGVRSQAQLIVARVKDR
jgi:two-component system nitrate/nitrite response regulator NarL